MAQQTIAVGTLPNDGTGDVLRVGWTKANANFTELYGRVQGNAPFVIAVKGVNLNSVADTPVVVPLPPGVTVYKIRDVLVSNPVGSPLASLTTAKYGIFSAAAGGGTAVVANNTVLSGITTNTDNVSTSVIVTTVAGRFNFATLFIRCTTAQGAAASADFYIEVEPLG